MYFANNFRLKPKLGPDGKVALRLDNIAWGISMIVFGLMFAVGNSVVALDFGSFDLASGVMIAAGVLCTVLGIRTLFTGTQLVFDTQRGDLDWHHRAVFRATHSQHRLSEFRLILHSAYLPNGLLDHDGFALSLVCQDGRSVQLARGSKMSAIREHAQQLQGLVGISVTDKTAEQSPPGDSLKAAPEE